MNNNDGLVRQTITTMALKEIILSLFEEMQHNEVPVKKTSNKVRRKMMKNLPGALKKFGEKKCKKEEKTKDFIFLLGLKAMKGFWLFKQRPNKSLVFFLFCFEADMRTFGISRLEARKENPNWTSMMRMMQDFNSCEC